MLLQQSQGATGQSSPGVTDSDGASATTLTSGAPGGQFSTDMLRGLLSMQEQPPPRPSASDIAGDLMSQFDTDGDGKLSSAEITQALGGDANSGDLTSALAKLDTNGDGQLSTDELTAGLQAAMKSHHGHHHHHQAQGATDANATTASSGTTSTTSATTNAADASTDTSTTTQAG